MKNRNNKRTLLRLASIIFGFMGLLTLVPCPASGGVSMLGYKAICPFAPISTIIPLYVFITIHRYLANVPG